MEKTRRVVYSVCFALFMLVWIAYSIFSASIGRFNWLYLSIPMVLVFSWLFVSETMKLKDMTMSAKSLKEEPEIIRVLHQKEKELVRTVEEIKADKDKVSRLKHEIEELSEEAREVISQETQEAQETQE